ncbi:MULTISPECIES: type VII secretion target [Catenuloplanes]|uniref:Histidine ammonia-lyase n=1 Tax=Catenuloplanes niger TaxID=587534 RepID=A0AAE3ZQ34_9ACTN|nr:type VII secretion target [Catenuloplanes niger]MDR7322836.1 histidine ammonia-lyase [Catenuloplanes niger]
MEAIDVTTPALRACADRLAAVARRLLGMPPGRLSVTAPGWASTGASADLADAAWSALDRCGTGVAAAASALARAATAYEAVDQSTAARLRRLNGAHR